MSADENPVAWLRAQVEARKAAAEAASEGPWDASAVTPSWAGFTEQPLAPAKVACLDDDEDNCLFVALRFGLPPERNEANAAHIAANDPRDTIARCEAELAILDEHGPDDTFGPGDVCCCACGDRPQVPFPCRTVRLLAGGYRHRPGYPAAFVAPD